MEILVDQVFDEISKNYEICNNESCIDDIKSIALNNLEPKYFTSKDSSSERVAFLLDKQRRITVTAAIIQAQKKVCKQCKKNED